MQVKSALQHRDYRQPRRNSRVSSLHYVIATNVSSCLAYSIEGFCKT